MFGNSSVGNFVGSCWGVKGIEDFGGGLKVLFQLENGFDLSNGWQGQGGCLFGW